MMNSRTLFAAVVLGCLSFSHLPGQDDAFRGAPPRVIRAVRPANLGILINDVGNEQDEPAIGAGSASLKTDPDLEQILKKAERYQQDGNYSVACQLWQTVLEKSGDTLFSLDGTTYFSMIEQVEKTLGALPIEGLQVYRITADAAARQILAQAPHPFDVEALSAVVRRYFVSSVGDDAAFRLACVYLDQFDFVGALRLLKKVDSQHPDSSIPRDEVINRIALCQILMGDVSGAENTLNRLAAVEPSRDSGLAMVRELFGHANSGALPGFEKVQAYNFRTFRVAPNLPDDYLAAELTAVWQYYFEPTANGEYRSADRKNNVLGTSGQVPEMDDTVTQTERELIEKWQSLAWQPAGFLLVDQASVFFKSPIDVSAWSVDLTEKPNWRSVWLNTFESDDTSRMIEMIRTNWGGARTQTMGGGNKRPDTRERILLFGDRVHGQLSLHNGTLYAIEGSHSNSVKLGNSRGQGIPWNSTFRRSRSNTLCAYDAASGRLLWSLPKTVENASGHQSTPETGQESEYLQNGGFMGAPVQFGNTLLVPVNQGGAIQIYALDARQKGRTLWKTFLCDEPESSAEPWSPIQLTLDGSDLFAPTGMGVVFVLDPATGAIRFAQRYARAGTRNDMLRNIGYQVNRMDFDGWSEDVIIPYGRQMICFASDSNQIFAIDRNNGKLIWETDMNPLGQKLDYVLGIYDDKLFAAGRQTIIAFDLLGEGRMLWGGDDLFSGAMSCGRGLLTPNAIYMPVNDTIWQFDPMGDGGRAAKIFSAHVTLPIGSPVGNLASDGRRLWAHQATRVVALEPKPANPASDADSQ